MSQGRFRAIIAFIITCQMYQSFSVAATISCSGEQTSTYGMMLKGHAFNKIKVANWPQCIIACNAESRCQSLNYAIDKGMCELNSRTKEARPDDFVPAGHRAYMTRPSERGILKH